MEIADETELEEYSVEIDILSQCRHKNIVGIYEAYYFNSKLCVSILFVCLQFCSHVALKLTIQYALSYLDRLLPGTVVSCLVGRPGIH